MNRRNVLDSSAFLAAVNFETGGEKVESLFTDSVMSSVNVAEVYTKFAERDINLEDSAAYFSKLGIETVDFDLAQARKCGELRSLTRHLGLSLGDRACLALAIQHNATAVTADKNWEKLDLCKIELIR